MKLRLLILLLMLVVIVGLLATYFLQRSPTVLSSDTGVNLIISSQNRRFYVAEESLYPEVLEAYKDKPDLFMGMTILIGDELPIAPIAGSALYNATQPRDTVNTKFAYKYVPQPGDPLLVEAFVNPNAPDEEYERFINDLIVTTILQYKFFANGEPGGAAVVKANEIMQQQYEQSKMLDL